MAVRRVLGKHKLLLYDYLLKWGRLVIAVLKMRVLIRDPKNVEGGMLQSRYPVVNNCYRVDKGRAACRYAVPNL